MAKPTVSEGHGIPDQIRVSVGSAIVLGLLEGKLDAEPTTAYLMTYKTGKCSANCGFCPQAKGSLSKSELLSRVSWPPFSSQSVIGKITSAVQTGKIKRVCIQTLNYPQAFTDLCQFVKELKQHTSVPVSVSCQPQSSQNIWDLSHAGANRIGIALDAATEELFDKVKGEIAGGPYNWEEEFVQLRTAIAVFGEGNVSTHLIVGLGETEKEAAKFLQTCVRMGILPGLFAFTPVRGTALFDKRQPSIETYRRVQVARYLIVNGLSRFEDMIFASDGHIVDFGLAKNSLEEVIDSGGPFLTPGCPDCNRPFYNEKPSGPIYNYPRKLTLQEIVAIKRQLDPQLGYA